jgi:2-polyprenyl-3-methyl-5-hydroxy-6-metoxy-1,4-benzoquinol methylase
MGFYDDKENVEQYLKIASGYDGSFLMTFFADIVPEGATVLELGMGPGKELDVLKERYMVTGSDNSDIFLDMYRAAHPQADLLKLNAVTLNTNRRFDAIFSNKVLQHLTDQELVKSFRAQQALLNDGGTAVHTFWAGSGSEEMMGLYFNYHDEESLTLLIGDILKIEKMVRYKEEEDDDSIVLVLKK